MLLEKLFTSNLISTNLCLPRHKTKLVTAGGNRPGIFVWFMDRSNKSSFVLQKTLLSTFERTQSKRIFVYEIQYLKKRIL